jgi:hypothetical protein
VRKRLGRGDRGEEAAEGGEEDGRPPTPERIDIFKTLSGGLPAIDEEEERELLALRPGEDWPSGSSEVGSGSEDGWQEVRRSVLKEVPAGQSQGQNQGGGRNEE